MIQKLVKRQLTRIHGQWIESIDNKTVQDLAQKGSIITGGAIVSLLTNQPVSDYDIYFKDRETCLELANYYVNKFIAINHDKLPNKPELQITENGRIKIYTKSSGIVSETGSGEQAYAVFENNPNSEAEGFVDEMTKTVTEADEIAADGLEGKNKSKFRPIFFTSNAITLSDKIQLVIRFYGSPDEIHSNYDFVHCMNHWTSWDNHLELKKEALASILTKQLIYLGSKYPLASVIRLRKFIRRGWSVNAGQILKICYQLSQLDLNDLNVLEEQLVGVDNAYFVQLIRYLRERQDKDKDFRVTMGYLESIVDKIF